MMAGLSPLIWMTGGVSVASASSADAPPLPCPDDCEALAAATIAWNWAGVTQVEPTQSFVVCAVDLPKLPTWT